MDGSLELEERALGVGAEAVLEQVGAEDGDGVLRAGGHARVAADAVRGDAGERLAVLAGILDLKVSRDGQRTGIRADDGCGKARDGVGGAASLDRANHGTLDGARDGSGAEGRAIEALLAAAHRELGVWREEEVRLGVVVEVVLDVAHVGLLVGAEDHAQGVRQALARGRDALREEAASVEREHRGTLVVDDAAAEEPAVATDHLEGIGVPARAGGDDVDVRNRGDLLLGLTDEIRIAEVALAIMRLEAADVGDAECLVECRAGTGAPRGALGGMLEVLLAAVANESLDVIEDLRPHAVDKLLDVCL